MAFNSKAFKTRAFTAIFFTAVMLTGLLWNHWSFLILFLIIHIGCWIEFQQVMGKIDEDYKHITDFHKYAVIVAGCGLMLWMTDTHYRIGSVLLNEVGLWLMYILVIALPLVEVVQNKNFSTKMLGYSLLGLLYISVSMALLIALRTEGAVFEGSSFAMDLGWIIPVTIIATLWINDTMAYIVGSFFGKTPLSKISPNKTWEGTLGGAILAISVVTIAGKIFLYTDVLPLIGLCTVTVIAGTFGDLLESKLKRMAGIKDSGSILPGHGGFLDRFDSLLLATPFAWMFAKLLLQNY